MFRKRAIFVIENVSFPRDRRVRQEAAALVENGWKVSVICPRGEKLDTKSYEVVEGVQVYRYWQPWQGKGVVGYLLEYGWAMVLTFALVSWIWMKEGFDVLHAANPPDMFFIVAAPFKLLKKKFVFDQHDLCPELLEAKLGKRAILGDLMLFLERRSFRLADLIIVTNRSGQEISLQRGAKADQVHVVRNGPDLEHFRDVPPDPALKGTAKHLAVYVGTLAAQDGVDRVVKALQHIVQVRGRNDLKVAILGDGDCLAELQALADSLGVRSFIEFTGWVGDADLMRFIATADACLAPDPPLQINQLSTFIKIMEYMCYGKVTVSFDLLESRRTAGPSGIYVEKDDPALFGDALLGILDDPQLRKEMGRIARERVRSSLHWGISQAALVEAYERAFWEHSTLRTDRNAIVKRVARGGGQG